MLQFRGGSDTESLILAATVFSPGERTLLFTKGEYVLKNEMDQQGDLCALVSVLILCLELDIKNVCIEGDSSVIKNEKAEFLNMLFASFEYVYFKDTVSDTKALDGAFEQVEKSKTGFLKEN